MKKLFFVFCVLFLMTACTRKPHVLWTKYGTFISSDKCLAVIKLDNGYTICLYNVEFDGIYLPTDTSTIRIGDKVSVDSIIIDKLFYYNSYIVKKLIK